MTVIKQWCFI